MKRPWLLFLALYLSNMLFPEIIWGQETTTSRKAWKRDLKIYDLPGWNSYTYNFPYAGGIRKRGDNEIVVQFETADSSGINDDFYVEHHRRVTLSSKDYGTTWKEIQPDWQYSMPLRLSDGTLVEVVHATTLRTPEQQKSRLERLGIGHIWRDDCHMPWDIWPSHMAEELRERGMLIWDIRVGSASPFDIYLPEATIAT
ncbi:MAG: glycoside hydrolase, partial [Pirellulaceae bacterium]|nr:glycoside hydrolase [Pirellulaceae bacterium]